MKLFTFSLLPFLFFFLPTSEVHDHSSASDTEIVCFIYHRIGDPRYPSTNTSIKDFESHLAYLTRNGFTVLNFSDALDQLRTGTSKKIAVITVDDGYTSFYKNGLPLLKKYKVPATLFINTKTVGGGDYMGWEELKAAMKAGVEIGNHTHSHDFFLNQPAPERYDTFRDEIVLSQNLIREHLGIAPDIFSFPYGEFDPRMKAIVKEEGFRAAAAQKSGVWYDGSDWFQLSRFPMSEAYSSIEKFKEKANMKALKISTEDPDSYIKPASNTPKLTVTFDPDGLRLDEMQCFIQGAKCTLKVIDRNKATVSIQADQSIAKRRRTIYTITVQDKKGQWYWHSHLWINAAVKDKE